MSHVVQEANLSCSSGKNGQSVRRSSTRSRSISVARAKEAARIAELQAEVNALKQRQSLTNLNYGSKRKNLI